MEVKILNPMARNKLQVCRCKCNIARHMEDSLEVKEEAHATAHRRQDLKHSG